MLEDGKRRNISLPAAFESELKKNNFRMEYLFRFSIRNYDCTLAAYDKYKRVGKARFPVSPFHVYY